MDVVALSAANRAKRDAASARAYSRGRNAPAGPIMCAATLTSVKPIPGTGANTALSLQQEEIDTDGFHSNTTNSSRFTIPAGMGGIYEVVGAIEFPSNATGFREAIIYKNGISTGSPLSKDPKGAVTNGRATVCTAKWSGYLTAGDYVELVGWQDSTVSLNAGTTYTRLSMIRRGDRRGPGGAVLFDPDLKYKDFAAYQSAGAIVGGPVGGVLLGDHVQIVDDPKLGPARQVLQVQTTNSDNSVTYPRNQLQGPPVHASGDDVYAAFSVLVPDDTALFGSMTGTRSPVLHEIYGPPTNGYGPNVLRVRDDKFALEPTAIYNTDGSTTGAFLSWSLPLAPLRGKWVDFIHRIKLSADPAVGLHELWVNTGAGYVHQTLADPVTGTTVGTTLALATLRTGVNDGGNNFSSLKLAYTDLSIGSVTALFVPARVCTTYAEASATSSY